MSNVLSVKDANASLTPAQEFGGKTDGKPEMKPGMKSMEDHRRALKDKIEQGEAKQYISPSDNIMSPCTAKLNAFRNKQLDKAKPKSLFAKASSKKLESEGLFGGKP